MVTLLLVFMIGSCSSTKHADSVPVQKESTALYNATWELEYISGIQMAFEDLFPDKKPELKFDSTGNMVRGHAGCNGYSAMFTTNGSEISFSNPAPSTLKYCGKGEPQFIETMKEINRYSIDTEGKLNLMINGVPLMRFHKQ